MAYLLLLVYCLFYSARFGRVGNEEYRYNLTFMQEISRFYNRGINTGRWDLFILNVVGNVVVFLPIGMFLPKLVERCRNLITTTLFSFELSLCIEVIQLVTKTGSFDVDDLFLNTIGGCLGCLIYLILHGIKYIWHRK